MSKNNNRDGIPDIFDILDTMTPEEASRAALMTGEVAIDAKTAAAIEKITLSKLGAVRAGQPEEPAIRRVKTGRHRLPKWAAAAACFALAVVLTAAVLPAILIRRGTGGDIFVGGFSPSDDRLPESNVDNADRLFMYGLVYYADVNLFKINESSGFYRLDAENGKAVATGLRAPVSPMYNAPSRDGYAYFSLSSADIYNYCLGYDQLGAGGIWRQNLTTGKNELYISIASPGTAQTSEVYGLLIDGDMLYYSVYTNTDIPLTGTYKQTYVLKKADMTTGEITVVSRTEETERPFGVYGGRLYCIRDRRNIIAYSLSGGDTLDFGLDMPLHTAEFDGSGNGNILITERVNTESAAALSATVFSPDGTVISRVSSDDVSMGNRYFVYNSGKTFNSFLNGRLAVRRNTDNMLGWYDCATGGFESFGVFVPDTVSGQLPLFSVCMTQYGLLIEAEGKLYLYSGGEAVPVEKQ